MFEQHSVVVTPHTCRSMEKADMEVFCQGSQPTFHSFKVVPASQSVSGLSLSESTEEGEVLDSTDKERSLMKVVLT